MTRPIFFLTDFGLADTYVGVVKAVILGIAPGATIVDLTHDLPAQDVRAGAFALWTAAPYLPPDAVVLAVVDPGVGTARRPIAVEAEGRLYVGPDNGVLSWVVGGEWRGVTLDRPQFWRPMVSASFHGRDLFGPVAAHLASDVPLDEVGSPLDALVRLPFPSPLRDLDASGTIGAVRSEVIHVDRFGNLITNLTAADLPPDPIVTVAGRTIRGLVPHFQATAPLIALIGSSGLLEVAVPNGSAASALGVGVGAAVVVRSVTIHP
jgi:S-adenosyl-L-methionine hydrolase (adenosine-forming)